MNKHILMVVTNAKEMKEGHATGLWLSEFAEAYIEFKNAGYTITVASPNGGESPIDARSLEDEVPAEIQATAPLLKETLDLKSIEDFSAFDAIFMPGGHGTMFDLPQSDALNNALRTLFEANKTVAAVCHGPAGLVSATLSDGTLEKRLQRSRTKKSARQDLMSTCHSCSRHAFANSVQTSSRLIISQKTSKSMETSSQVKIHNLRLRSLKPSLLHSTNQNKRPFFQGLFS